MPEVVYMETRKRLVVRIAEDLKSTTVGAAHEWLRTGWPDERGRPMNQVYLDLRNARIIDSTGINWIFLFNAACRESGIPLTIQVASPAAMRVFAFAGIDRLATIKFRRRKQL